MDIASILNQLKQEPYFKQWLFNMFHIECATNVQIAQISLVTEYFIWSKSKEGHFFWSGIYKPYHNINHLKLTYKQFKNVVYEHFKNDYIELMI